jgi:2-keto-4-pentenoate hydratase/2-oxohepta-3-ene-1,7-dioic acid hydratase in catechol pathway
MKLLRCGPKGAEKPCILAADGTVRDLSGRVPDFAGPGVSFAALDAIRRIDPMGLPVVPAGTRIGACLADVPNFHCIGLNYARHAAETGAKAPPEPILFNKATSTLAGPNDPVVIPKDSVKSDWEVELGVVLGRDVEHVSEAEALACVSAYCIVNDLSEREWQMERAGQWTKGKSAPGFGPTGPWLVTADEVPDPQALDLWLELNGTKVQNSSTSDMIYGVAQIIASMSRYMRLRTGDLICTGTPEGVGLGMKPPRYLVPGDRMRLGIAGLGVQEQAVVAWGG